MSNISIIILSAGKGTRMKSSIPKVMHRIANRPMIEFAIDTAKKIEPNDISIVISEDISSDFSEIKNKYSDVKFLIQKERLGTANAASIGLESIKNIGDIVIILYGDTPFIEYSSLNKMIDVIKNGNSVCVLAFELLDESNMYGRLKTSGNDLLEIVEYKDASEDERKIKLCNTGVIAISGSKIKNLLKKINNNNASNEYYLTDIVKIAKSENLNCSFVKINDNDEIVGINSRIELSEAEKIFQNKIRNKMMKNGVTLIDPNSVYFSHDTKIENDVVIHPNVTFGIGVEIKSSVEIKSFSHIEEAKISSNSSIGPFARIRGGVNISNNVKIGNFVEIKKSYISQNTRISHLSYIGDSEIDDNVNIGAGVITCNYDGHKKYITKIGKNSFIGSNSSLIAPINIGDNCLIAAGSVITKDINNNDLAISRQKQISINNGATRYHNNKKDN